MGAGVGRVAVFRQPFNVKQLRQGAFDRAVVGELVGHIRGGSCSQLSDLVQPKRPWCDCAVVAQATPFGNSSCR